MNIKRTPFYMGNGGTIELDKFNLQRFAEVSNPYTTTIENNLGITIGLKGPKEVVIKVGNAFKRYGSEDSDYSDNYELLMDGEDVTSDINIGDIYIYRESSDDSIGFYDNDLTAEVDNLNALYTYTVDPGCFYIIDGNSIPITITTDGGTKAYNGTPLTVGTYTIECNFPNFDAYKEISVEPYGSQTGVGSSSNYFNYYLSDKCIPEIFSITTNEGILIVKP